MSLFQLQAAPYKGEIGRLVRDPEMYLKFSEYCIESSNIGEKEQEELFHFL